MCKRACANGDDMGFRRIGEDPVKLEIAALRGFRAVQPNAEISKYMSSGMALIVSGVAVPPAPFGTPLRSS